jgi:hypothetical protein
MFDGLLPVEGSHARTSGLSCDGAVNETCVSVLLFVRSTSSFLLGKDEERGHGKITLPHIQRKPFLVLLHARTEVRAHIR